MTQIRRHKGGASKDQNRTLVCVAAAVLSTLMLVVLFLQIDSWPSKHNHARMIKPPGLTPGVVGTELLESITSKQQQQQQQQQQKRRVNGGRDEQQQNLRRPRAQNERRPIPVEEQNGGGEDEEEVVGDENEEVGVVSPDEEPSGGVDLAPPPEQQHGEEPQPQLQLQGRTFVMELENLKPDTENGGTTSGTVVF
jgi:hypothetical protein